MFILYFIGAIYEKSVVKSGECGKKIKMGDGYIGGLPIEGGGGGLNLLHSMEMYFPRF